MFRSKRLKMKMVMKMIVKMMKMMNEGDRHAPHWAPGLLLGHPGLPHWLPGVDQFLWVQDSAEQSQYALPPPLTSEKALL